MLLLRCVFLVVLLARSHGLDCSDPSNAGKIFAEDATKCQSSYHMCHQGKKIDGTCAPGTFFDPDNLTCTFKEQISVCQDELDCKESEIITYATNCNDGVYYMCIGGKEVEMKCLDGLIFDVHAGVCNWPSAVPDCTASAKTTTTTKIPSAPVSPTTGKPIPVMSTVAGGESGIDCTDPKHDGETFIDDDGCHSSYFKCINGEKSTATCAGGTAYDPNIGQCNHISLVSVCEGVGCRDADGKPINGAPYVEVASCNDGVYFQCDGGSVVQKQCTPDGFVFDPRPAVQACVDPSTIPDCSITKPPPTPNTTATKTTASAGSGVTTGAVVVGPNITLSTTTTTKATTSAESMGPEEDTTELAEPTAPIGEDTTKLAEPTPPSTGTKSTAKPTSTPTKGIDCTDPKHDAETFIDDDGCHSSYFKCINGKKSTQTCPVGTAYDPKIGLCNHIDLVSLCEGVGCRDADGEPINGSPYVEVASCNDGVYFQCDGGSVVQKQCTPDGYVFDPRQGVQACVHPSTIADCSITKPIPSVTTGPVVVEPNITVPASAATSTPPSTTAMKTTASAGSGETTGAVVVDPNITLSTTTTTKSTTPTESVGPEEDTTELAEPTPPIGEDTTKLAGPTPSIGTKSTAKPTPTKDGSTTTTTTSTTTTTTTTSGTQAQQSLTYVAFVVDDTGSMSNEIVAVKEWITNCIDGKYEQCGAPPTGGWIVTSFNDPYIGDVTGPTTNVHDAIAAVERLYAHNGGDCPEMAYAGLKQAVDAVPEDNGGCKVFFYTDALAKDEARHSEVLSLYDAKGCSFIPVLTACCAPCESPCESTDPDYCINHVTDSTTSTSKRRRRSTTTSGETLYYALAEKTGGNIYVTEKPSSPEDLLDFMEEEVTMGFCPTNEIAGPKPDGYQCEADCVAMSMCWDRGVSTCYCNGSIPCAYDPVPAGYSKCAGAQEIICDPDVVLQIIPDQNNCKKFYECNHEQLYSFTCANGTIFSSESPSYCDFKENVPPPCGTRSTPTKTLD